MFQKDDIITYGTAGVCKITEIIEKDFSGARQPYYELRPVYDEKSTLFVPVDNPALAGKMHRLLSAEDIHALIHSAPEETLTWIADESSRKQYYKDILDHGDRKALINTLRMLYHHRQDCQTQGKKVHVCDERFFKEAERVLYDEFAYVLRLERDQILQYILSQLEEPA